jgi:hypothetical protein
MGVIADDTKVFSKVCSLMEFRNWLRRFHVTSGYAARQQLPCVTGLNALPATGTKCSHQSRALTWECNDFQDKTKRKLMLII